MIIEHLTTENGSYEILETPTKNQYTINFFSIDGVKFKTIAKSATDLNEIRKQALSTLQEIQLLNE